MSGNILEATKEAMEILAPAPTEDEIRAMWADSQARGCGLSMKKGRPSTLRVNPAVPAGMTIVVDPAALAYPSKETP